MAINLKASLSKLTVQSFIDELWISGVTETILKIRSYLLSYFFGSIPYWGTSEAPAVNLLKLNTLRGTKIAFLIPKRYDGHPRSFYTGVPRLPDLKAWIWHCQWKWRAEVNFAEITGVYHGYIKRKWAFTRLCIMWMCFNFVTLWNCSFISSRSHFYFFLI